MMSAHPAYESGRLLGSSACMKQVFEMISKAAETSVPVLVVGETGTGKELVAEEIHARSARHAKPYIAVNTGALSKELVASELFGHVRGAFTGATDASTGRFAEADKGTLFLDEVATMSEQVQIVFLRVLETGAFRPVGAKEERKVDVRVVAATNMDLRVVVNNGTFREDLLQRLTVFRIVLPPLRERLEDLPLLARHFLQCGIEEFNLAAKGITDEALALLMDYPWPGNVRELRNAIIQAAIMAGDGFILPAHIPPRITSDLVSGSAAQAVVRSSPASVAAVLPADSHQSPLIVPVGRTLDDVQRAYVLKTLSYCGDNKAKAARLLGISRKTLRLKLERWGLVASGVEHASTPGGSV